MPRPSPDRPSAGLPPVDRAVLVGFMGAGKSTVGPLLAHRLGWRFVDLDREVERRAGATVHELFASRGEAAFRALEAEATEALDGSTESVVAAGGGWMARPELRDRWPGAVRIWLQVRPETALARLGEGVASRPLLEGSDPASAARRLLARRTAAYAGAELAVDTEGRTPEEVAEAAYRRLRRLIEDRSADGTFPVPPAYQ